MSNWQDALSSVRCDCIQASILPPPGFTPAQIFLTSPRHAFPIAAALTKMVWHVGVRSFKCKLMQALMRPAPGCTPPHCALTSAAHSFGTAATVLVAERKRMAPIAQIFFSISLSLRFLLSQIELGRDGLQRRPLHTPKLTQMEFRVVLPIAA
jgi:hypothetical protein